MHQRIVNDRHLNTDKRQNAFIWQAEDGNVITMTYLELHEKVNQFAHMLKHQFNIKKGDRVTPYLPLVPELAVAVLGCARIGAIHSVVFGGFFCIIAKR